MKPATAPREDARLLVIDPDADALADARFNDLPRFIRPGDVIVLNDAATLPGSLFATLRGEPVELRFLSVEPPRAVLFGAGDHRTRTEHRAPPPPVSVGDRIDAFDVIGVNGRLLDLAGDAVSVLYARGRPIQYAHVREPLPLYAVQTLYASRPWAAEMPSAGRPIRAETLHSLERAGAKIVTLTEAAGVSATGDPAIDDALPLPERYAISAETARAVREATRVIAVGTSVTRALEGCYATFGEVREIDAITSLRIDENHALQVVDALLTGMHEQGTSHYDLMQALAGPDLLTRGDRHATEQDYLAHEFGDATLIMRGALAGALLQSVA
jgi:S-adenosylmethionine:tRNA ribosyltransferase-isomerase